jgi:hypothetical protein
MIAAEAIFLAGERGASAHKVSLRAALLLEDATRPAHDVATVMKRAYSARSDLAHGGVVPKMRLPDGSEVPMEKYVGIVSDYLRDSLQRLIASVAAGEPSPLDDWNRFTFDRLSSR